MENFHENDIEIKREMNKISLDTFVLDKHNILDFPIDKLIENLKLDINKLYDEHKKLIDLSSENPKLYEELDEIAQQTGHILHIQEYEYIQDIHYTEDELFVLFEMKIIYSFKHLEINIKNLISASYEDKSVNKQFNWRDLNQYLTLKNIDIKTINGYAEVDQLREVNNSLKHSTEIKNDNIKKITEFKSKEEITYRELEKFYKRIKEKPKEFLSSLSYKIYQDIYEFDNNKILEIAKSYASRMNKYDAEKLTIELLKLY